jgi:putative FmdB family regulatory protein
MPLYEYVCRDCARRFERLVRAFNEPTSCPDCQSASVDRQLSTFAMTTGGGSARDAAPALASGGGGCCGGGGCGCRH